MPKVTGAKSSAIGGRGGRAGGRVGRAIGRAARRGSSDTGKAPTKATGGKDIGKKK